MSIRDCPSYPCPPEEAKDCNDCPCPHCPKEFTGVGLGLRERSQPDEAQRPRAECPPAFTHYCVLDDGTACPYYHEGHCAKAQEEEMAR